MKKFLLSIILLLTFTSNSSAEVRTQGRNISDWSVYTKAKGKITESSYSSIVFSGEKMDTGYQLNISHLGANRIAWIMIFTEYYAIYLDVFTNKGNRTLRYTSLDKDLGIKNGYINFGLGSDSRKGYSMVDRDIEKDLKKFEPDIELLSIQSFKVRGSGTVGRIKTVSPAEDRVIENANYNKIQNWSFFTKIKGTVIGYEDTVKLSGQGLKTGYSLSFPKLDKKYNILSWDMKYSENYVIYILVYTNKGAKYLRYSSLNYDKGVNGKYISYGLGAKSKDGKWHTFRRNLEKDLSRYIRDIKVLSINAFMIKGSGLVDNIKVIKGEDKQEDTIIKVLSPNKFNSKKFKELLNKELEGGEAVDGYFKQISNTDDKRIKGIRYTQAGDDSEFSVLFTLSEDQTKLKAIDSYGFDNWQLHTDVSFEMNKDIKIMTVHAFDYDGNDETYRYFIQDI